MGVPTKEYGATVRIRRVLSALADSRRIAVRRAGQVGVCVGLSAVAFAAGGWPDMMRPVASRAHAPLDAAVVIGVESYRSLPLNPFAKRDADMFSQWLTYTRGVPTTRVKRLIDPTRTYIEASIANAAEQVQEGGVLWVFYSGHGVASQVDGKHHLLGRDDTLEGESLTVEGIEQVLASSKAAHALLVLDTSFGGVTRTGEALADKRRYVVPSPSVPTDARVSTWLGTGPRELSGIHEDRQGIFTYLVLGALQGWADGVFGDADGVVTLEEAQTWVRRRMEILSWPQTPTIDPRPSARGWAVAKAYRPEPNLENLALKPPIVDEMLSAMEPEPGEVIEEANADPQWASREIRKQVQTQADADWVRVYALALGGTREGLEALQAFILRYTARTYLWDGQEIVVSATQVPEARRLLASRGKVDAPLVSTVRIEPGRVRLGTPEGTPGRGLSEVMHDVRVTRPFLMGETEVTQSLYTKVVGVSLSERAGESLPMESVPWIGAILFCNALSALDGLPPAYTFRGKDVSWDRASMGWRLPTEAEWMLAAGQGDYAGTSDANGVCSYANLLDASAAGAGGVLCDDGSPFTMPIRTKKPNAHGLYDMSGNVAEWVWDAFTISDGSAEVDPAPDKPRRTRVVKGGSFRSGSLAGMLHRREGVQVDTARDDVGFRVVRNAEAQ